MEEGTNWQQRLLAQPYVTVEEAGRLLNVGRGTSYGLVRDGILPVHKYGRLMRVPTQPLIDLLLNGADRADDGS